MTVVRVVSILVVSALLSVVPPAPAKSDEMRRLLSAEQHHRYEQVIARRQVQASVRVRYWSEAERLRAVRQAKRRSGQPVGDADFIRQHPPQLPPIAMPADIAVSLRRPAVGPQSAVPSIADIMTAAREHHGFQPRLVSEADFKRRYAEASLAAGLEPLHVIRVFALETGGMGTFDMQSGINHQTGQGRPASTAIGYSQLLAANTIGELAKHGETFIRTLERSASQTPSLKRELAHRIQALRSMSDTARSVPNSWNNHVALAGTAPGLGIHALNLDGEIGPMLQIGKLRELLFTARRELGRDQITGAELEIMNLAGPRNGLDMIQEPGRRMPTANFFTSGGYARNPIVHGKSGSELLMTLGQRMDVHMSKSGTQEFIAAFESLTRIGTTRPNPARASLGMSR